MKGIPERGNALVTELSLDDAADYRFEKLYRKNRIEKTPDYQYHCAYLRFHQIYDTFGGKRYPKPSANRFHGSSHGSSLNGHERLRFSHTRSGRAEPRPLFLRCKRNAENTPVRNFRGTAKSGETRQQGFRLDGGAVGGRRTKSARNGAGLLANPRLGARFQR